MIISGLLFPGGPPDKVVRSVLTGRMLNATSPDLLTELRRVFKKKFLLSEKKLDELIRLISETSEITYPVERLKVIKPDDADNRVLECALTARADFIVTGDEKHLLKLRSFQRIPILRPSAFMERAGIF